MLPVLVNGFELVFQLGFLEHDICSIFYIISAEENVLIEISQLLETDSSAVSITALAGRLFIFNCGVRIRNLVCGKMIQKILYLKYQQINN